MSGVCFRYEFVSVRKKKKEKSDYVFSFLIKGPNTWAKNVSSSSRFLLYVYGSENLWKHDLELMFLQLVFLGLCLQKAIRELLKTWDWAHAFQLMFSMLFLQKIKFKVEKTWAWAKFSEPAFFVCNFFGRKFSTSKNYKLHPNFSKCILDHTFVKIVNVCTCKMIKTF